MEKSASALVGIKTNNIPSDSMGEASDKEVCGVCLRSDCELFPMLEHKTLYQAYLTLRGLSVDNEDNLPSHLCYECANRLLHYDSFRFASVLSHWNLLHIVKNHGHIIVQSQS